MRDGDAEKIKKLIAAMKESPAHSSLIPDDFKIACLANDAMEALEALLLERQEFDREINWLCDNKGD